MIDRKSIPKAQSSAWATTDDGLAVVADGALRVLEGLDNTFTAWAAAAGASQRHYSEVLPAHHLQAIDYFQNFPHLGSVVTGLSDRAQERYHEEGLASGHISPEDLRGSTFVLPSAACYSVFFELSGRAIDESHLVTTRASCFRTESTYEGLRRLWNFQMREIVYVGSSEGAKEHVAAFRDRIEAFGEEVGLELRIEAATDPFYSSSEPRAVMQRLDPVKWEIISDGSAIASVNLHRNFFGERCDINDPSGSPVFTSCVAFGLERWLRAISVAHNFDFDAILDVLSRDSSRKKSN